MQWVKKRLLVIVSIFFLCAFFSFATPLIVAPVANAQTNTTNTNTADTGVTCAIEKLGWILCPVIETGAKISDSMFQIIADNFLRTDPQLVSNSNQGTRYAWDLARNLANIMFIIAFLIVIFSQVTGQGISNYGIKRMLPRLIIAAILVNLSYIICQAAVDLSNILGYEIKNALSDAAKQVGPSVFSQASQYSSFERTTTSSLSAGVLWTIAIAILATGAIVWAFIGPLLGTIAFAVVTLLVIVVILMLRKALIVLLVVISPIAFVLYLLPNTEKLFNRWAKMFVQLLMVFPVVALLFGAGQLASTIILVSSPPVSANQNCDTNTNTTSTQQTNAQKDPNSPVSFGSCEGSISIIDPQTKKSGAATWTTGLIATGVAVAPLLAVWSVLKGALSAAGAIGGRITALGSRAAGGARGLGGKLDKRKNENTKARWQNYRSGSLKAIGEGKANWRQRAVGRFTQKEVLRQTRLKSAETDIERQRQEYVASVLSASGPQKPNNMSDQAWNALSAKEKADVGLFVNGQSKKDYLDKTKTLSGLSDVAQQRLTDSARATQGKIVQEELAAATATADLQDTASLNATVDLMLGGKLSVEDPKVAAAISVLGNRGELRTLERVVNHVGNSGSSLASQSVSSALQQNAPELFTGGNLAAIARGEMGAGVTYSNTVDANIANNILSPEKIAGASPSILEEASRVVSSQAAKDSLKDASLVALTNDNLKTRVSRNKVGLTNLSLGRDSSGNPW